MQVSVRNGMFVGMCAVSQQERPWRNEFSNRSDDGFFGVIIDPFQTNAPDAIPPNFRRDEHPNFIPAEAPRATKKYLVNLNRASQLLPPDTHHRAAEFVQASPGRLVASKTQQALEV